MTENVFPKVDGDIFYASESNFQSGNFVTLEAGENLTAGEVCYIHLTDGKAYISDTGTANDIRANGIVMATVSSGADVTLQLSGVYITTSLTDKEDYYLGAAGAISTTASGVRVGTANGTTQLIINIVQDDRDVVGTIKAFHEDMTGMIANPLTAFWLECDGAAISDAESPFNSQNLPNLNQALAETHGYFLRGTGTGVTGLTEASQMVSHTHALSNGNDSASTGSYFEKSSSYLSSSSNTTSAGAGTETRPSAFTIKWIMKIK